MGTTPKKCLMAAMTLTADGLFLSSAVDDHSFKGHHSGASYAVNNLCKR